MTAGDLVEVREDTREGVSIALLTLASPPVNALGDELIAALAAGLERVETLEPRALVVASAFPRYFAVGADLKLLGQLDAARFDDYLTRVTGAIERVPALGIPSVAAISGQAVGGGLELALACTLRVAETGASLGLPEIKLGLLPGAGGTQRLPRLVGPRLAVDLLLSGRSIGAEEAAAAGLVDRVAAAGTAASAATDLAFELASMPQQAVAAILRCVDAALSTDLPAGLAFEAAEMRALFDTDDAREGVAAFLERRKASFS